MASCTENTSHEQMLGGGAAHHEAMTECLRSFKAGSLSKMSSSRRRLEPDVEMENWGYRGMTMRWVMPSRFICKYVKPSHTAGPQSKRCTSDACATSIKTDPVSGT